MTVWLWRILSRRVGGLGTRRINMTLLRMHVAALPGMVFALAVSVIIGRIAPAGTVTALAIVAIGGCGGLALYLLAARILNITEVSELTRSFPRPAAPGASRTAPQLISRPMRMRYSLCRPLAVSPHCL